MPISDHPTATFTLSSEELVAARAVVLAADPSEVDPAHGVALVVNGGTRSWTAWSPYVHAVTTPIDGPGEDDRCVFVSRRLVEFAAALADQGDEVALHVDHVGVEVTGGAVAMRFAHPPLGRTAPSAPSSSHGARATVNASALFQLLSMGRVLPVGVDLDEIDPPPFNLAIEDGRLVAAVDWSDAGVPATSLAIDAETTGRAVADIGPAIVANVARLTDPDEAVAVVIPTDAPWIVVECAAWTARIRSGPFGDDGAAEQLELPFWDTITCEGGLRPDPLPGATVTDVRAFALDPDLEVRLQAAASRGNWDLRVQLQLAVDDDERVVLALLDHVDPYREVCDKIIDGPHVAARRELAGRNLLTELLERLAADADPETAERAKRTLDARSGRTSVTAEARR